MRIMRKESYALARRYEFCVDLFSWQDQNLTRSLRSLVKYCSCHSKKKFIDSQHRVISSMYNSTPFLPNNLNKNRSDLQIAEKKYKGFRHVGTLMFGVILLNNVILTSMLFTKRNEKGIIITLLLY